MSVDMTKWCESAKANMGKRPAGEGRLGGKICIVTGAAQGFGKGIAEELYKEGATIVIADMNEPLAKQDVYKRQAVRRALPHVVPPRLHDAGGRKAGRIPARYQPRARAGAGFLSHAVHALYCHVLYLSLIHISYGINYSRFIYGLKKSGIEMNRKALSELAIADPEAFKVLVETAKKAL